MASGDTCVSCSCPLLDSETPLLFGPVPGSERLKVTHLLIEIETSNNSSETGQGRDGEDDGDDVWTLLGLGRESTTSTVTWSSIPVRDILATLGFNSLGLGGSQTGVCCSCGKALAQLFKAHYDFEVLNQDESPLFGQRKLKVNSTGKPVVSGPPPPGQWQWRGISNMDTYPPQVGGGSSCGTTRAAGTVKRPSRLCESGIHEKVMRMGDDEDEESAFVPDPPLSVSMINQWKILGMAPVKVKGPFSIPNPHPPRGDFQNIPSYMRAYYTKPKPKRWVNRCHICGMPFDGRNAKTELRKHLDIHLGSEDTTKDDLSKNGFIIKNEIVKKKPLKLVARIHQSQQNSKDNGSRNKEQEPKPKRPKQIFTNYNVWTCQESECGRVIKRRGPSLTLLEQEIKWHDHKHHSPTHSPFKCKICLKPFGFKSYLEVHLKTHLGEDEKEVVNSKAESVEKVKFNQCGKNLKSENRLRSNLKKYQLPRLPRKRNLIICHHPACLFICRAKVTMSQHQRIHLRPSDTTCKGCSRNFYSKANLRAHRPSCPGTRVDRPHGCSFCVARFKLKSSVLTHMTGVHKIIPERARELIYPGHKLRQHHLKNKCRCLDRRVMNKDEIEQEQGIIVID